MKSPEQFVKTISLVVVSFGIMISYQNCSSDNVKFSTVETILSSTKPDFKVNYTRELDVGNVGHFIVSSDDGQIERAEWIFDDGETMNALEGVRPFESVGLVKFDVKVKFANASDWIIKHNLQVNVIDPSSGTCLDLNDIRMHSEQVDFNAKQPTWQLSATPLRVRLNFAENCLAVHLYQVQWLVHTPTVPKGTIIHEQDGHVAEIPFNQAGTYHIVASIKYGSDPQIYEVAKILTVIDDPYSCKPAAGIGADKNLNNLIVGDSVTFNSMLFDCLGYTGKISWYIDGVFVGDTESITHVFNEINPNISIRADASKKDGTTDQFYLTAVVAENNYSWSCPDCGGGLVCRDSTGKVVDSFLCPKMPIEQMCPDICMPGDEVMAN